MMRNDEKILETALEIALDERIKKEVENDVYPEHVFSDAHNKKMELLFRSAKRKARQRAALRVAAAVVVAFVLLPVVLFNTVDAFKGTVLGWISGERAMELDGGDTSAMDGRLRMPDITGLSYELNAPPAIFDSQYICEYVDGETGRSFTVIGVVKDEGMGIKADNESEHAIYEFDGKKAYYLDKRPDAVFMIEDAVCMYTIFGDLSQMECEEIVKSIY